MDIKGCHLKASKSSTRLGNEVGWRRDKCEEELTGCLENPLSLSFQLYPSLFSDVDRILPPGRWGISILQSLEALT